MLSFTCTKFANKVVWVAKKNDWILSLSYKLQRSRMLFHKLEICSFSKKHYFSRSPFRAVKCVLTPPPLISWTNLQGNFLCNAALWIEWNSHKFVADGPGTGPVRSMSGISGLKMAIFGSVRVGENFIKIFCNRDENIITWRGGPGPGC